MSTSIPAHMAERYAAYRAQIQDQLRSCAPDGAAPMADACRHALAAGGKMLRSLLLLETCRAVGGNPDQALMAAVGTEAGQLASLVHDDIMDQDAMRRGQESVWKRYGQNTAILVGDYFIFQAFHKLAACHGAGIPAERVVRALRVVAGSCMDLCLGQDLEAAITGNLNAGQDAYLRVIQLKTAAFFRGAAESGAILGGGTEPQIAALARYGDGLGTAFQILDDLLSYTGTAEVMGKPITSDLRNRRITLPILLAYQQAGPAGRHFLTDAFTGTATAPEDAYARLVELLAETDALKQARNMALAHAESARNSLHTLPPSEARDHLDLLLALATDRVQ